MNKTLPANWEWTTFGEVAEYINGRGFSKDEWEEEGRPIIRIQNLTGTGDSVNRFSGEVDEKHIIRDGELLISWSATIDSHIYRGEEAALNQHIFKVNTKDCIEKLYLYYYTKSYIGELKKKSQGTGMKHITKSKFEESEIPLPPLKQQKRIVRKLEELFSKLESGVDELEQAKRWLDRYRRSVLKNALSGALSASWRRNNNNVTSPEELHIDEEPYYDIPDGWIEAKLSDICVKITDGTHNSPENGEDGDYMYITSKHLSNGELDTSDVTYVSEEDHKEIYSRCDPERGDVLYIKDGANTGIAVYNDIEEEFSMLSSVALLKPSSHINSYFLTYCLNSPVVRNQMVKKKGGVAIRRLTLTKMNDATVPVPPVEEQKYIVDVLDRLTSIIDNADTRIHENLKRTEKLRKSILVEAFQGNLVGSEPNDGTAEELLNQIESVNKDLGGQKTITEVTRNAE